MKKLTSSSLLLYACLMAAFLLPSCSQELVSPEEVQIEKRVTSRTDFSGLENQVKIKIAERDRIEISQITLCYYDGATAQGYGLYNYSTNIPSSGVYTVTGIIGDDVEGW